MQNQFFLVGPSFRLIDIDVPINFPMGIIRAVNYIAHIFLMLCL